MVLSESHKRIYWIDWLKTIAIILVIWAHINPYLYSWIHLFHMPLFFCISGFLYKKKNRTDELTSIWYSLLLPYIIYNALYFAILLFAGEFKWTYLVNALLGNQERMCVIFSHVNVCIDFRLMIPLWFVVSLSLMRIIVATHFKLEVISCLCLIVSLLLGGGG